MRILAGAAVRQNSGVLEAHLRTMLNQELREDVEMDLMYVNDLDMDDPDYVAARDVLFDTEGVQVLNTDPHTRPEGAGYGVNDDTHHWQMPTFEYLGGLKDMLLERAVADGYDAIWLVDTDLLVGPETLQSLIDSDCPVVSAVFWTSWSPGSPLLPQVWQRHPYELDGGRTKHIHVFLEKLSKRQLIPVGGLGACTLIWTEAIAQGLKYNPPIPELPEGGMWQGEDRHFCVRAQRHHIPLKADAWPDVYHVYRPSDREHIPGVLESLSGRRKPTPEIGDMISFTIEPLTIRGLAGYKLHQRGRLGQMDLLPELEQDLLDMEVGDDRLVTLNYPLWFPEEEIRGQTATMRVRLLDVKYYLPHVGMPYVVSSHQDAFYSPHQLTAMRKSVIHGPETSDRG